MVLFGTRGPLLCRVIRGAYSCVETRCTRHAEPTNLLETYPRTQGVPEPGSPPPRKIPRDGTESGQRHSSCLWLQISASNATPFFQTVNVITAIFRATVR